MVAEEAEEVVVAAAAEAAGSTPRNPFFPPGRQDCRDNRNPLSSHGFWENGPRFSPVKRFFFEGVPAIL